jgi:hypothetical protein
VPESDVKPAVDCEQEATLPDRGRPAGMGGLSVFDQTELVVPVSEAALARAREESQSNRKRTHWVAGGVFGVLLLAAFYLFAMNRPREQPEIRSTGVTSKATPPATVQARAPLEKTPKNPSFNEAKETEKPIRVQEKELPFFAGLEVMSIIGQTMEKLPILENWQPGAKEIRLLPADPRRIPWLWEVTVTIALTLKPTVPGSGPTRGSMVWKSLMQMTPELEGGECWREVTDFKSGKKTRSHTSKSEWVKGRRSRPAVAFAS